MSISPNRLKELQNIPDIAIDTSDIPELDQQFWETAKMAKPVSQEAIISHYGLKLSAQTGRTTMPAKLKIMPY
jgi:hypothetical protein